MYDDIIISDAKRVIRACFHYLQRVFREVNFFQHTNASLQSDLVFLFPRLAYDTEAPRELFFLFSSSEALSRKKLLGWPTNKSTVKF